MSELSFHCSGKRKGLKPEGAPSPRRSIFPHGPLFRSRVRWVSTGVEVASLLGEPQQMSLEAWGAEMVSRKSGKVLSSGERTLQVPLTSPHKEVSAEAPEEDLSPGLQIKRSRNGHSRAEKANTPKNHDYAGCLRVCLQVPLKMACTAQVWYGAETVLP